MLRGGMVIVLPPEVMVLTPFLVVETLTGLLGFELVFVGLEAGFFTGMPLGTGKTLFSDFLRLNVMPPLILSTSVSGLKLSTSTFPSSKVSPFFSHTPLFLALSKMEKYHSSLNLKKPLSSMLVFWGFGGGGGGVGFCMTLGLLYPGRRKGFCAKATTEIV